MAATSLSSVAMAMAARENHVKEEEKGFLFTQILPKMEGEAHVLYPRGVGNYHMQARSF